MRRRAANSHCCGWSVDLHAPSLGNFPGDEGEGAPDEAVEARVRFAIGIIDELIQFHASTARNVEGRTICESQAGFALAPGLNSIASVNEVALLDLNTRPIDRDLTNRQGRSFDRHCSRHRDDPPDRSFQRPGRGWLRWSLRPSRIETDKAHDQREADYRKGAHSQFPFDRKDNHCVTAEAEPILQHRAKIASLAFQSRSAQEKLC